MTSGAPSVDGARVGGAAYGSRRGQPPGPDVGQTPEVLLPFRSLINAALTAAGVTPSARASADMVG